MANATMSIGIPLCNISTNVRTGDENSICCLGGKTLITNSWSLVRMTSSASVPVVTYRQFSISRGLPAQRATNKAKLVEDEHALPSRSSWNWSLVGGWSGSTALCTRSRNSVDSAANLFHPQVSCTPHLSPFDCSTAIASQSLTCPWTSWA
ncbi:unnamed protein product [Phytophthora fragariaefolia]|uniref:Unnamed protein product n=1 Tax=Phytophthora fragariaefolia TaxID=1490495 RepID=A0A9W6X1G6_9STRA|nr:unnamed protein product [Phytophthora fragariaefolia]